MLGWVDEMDWDNQTGVGGQPDRAGEASCSDWAGEERQAGRPGEAGRADWIGKAG